MTNEAPYGTPDFPAPNLRVLYNNKQATMEIPQHLQKNPAEVGKFIMDRVPREPGGKATLELFPDGGPNEKSLSEAKAIMSRDFSFGMDQKDPAGFRGAIDAVLARQKELQAARDAKFHAIGEDRSRAGSEIFDQVLGGAAKTEPAPTAPASTWATTFKRAGNPETLDIK